MNLTREQIIELRGLLSQWEDDVEGAEGMLVDRLLDMAPSLIETAEWARTAVETIVRNELVPREHPDIRLYRKMRHTDTVSRRRRTRR